MVETINIDEFDTNENGAISIVPSDIDADTTLASNNTVPSLEVV